MFTRQSIEIDPAAESSRIESVLIQSVRKTLRRNGAVVRDLTTTQTETGNVYVVAPVPASVRTALGEAQGRQIPHGVIAKTEPAVDKSIPTPRKRSIGRESS